MILPNNKLIQ